MELIKNCVPGINLEFLIDRVINSLSKTIEASVRLLSLSFELGQAEFRWKFRNFNQAFRSMLRSRVQEHFPLYRYRQFNLQSLQLYNVQ